MQQAEREREERERMRHLPTETKDRRRIIMLTAWKQLFFQILLLSVSCRHVNTKTPGPTPPPLFPISPIPTDVRSVALKGESHTEMVEVLSPVNLALECSWVGGQSKRPDITGFWRKDGHEIENSQVTVNLENEQYDLKRVFPIFSEENLGNYSCMFGSEAQIEFVLAAPQIGEVRDKPIVSYVGDSAVFECKMGGTKPKPETWNWYKANGTDKDQILTAAEPHRYEIKNKEGKTRLRVHNLTASDSGLYYCGAVYPISTTMGHMELQVITLFEPLKPFIAIVVEVAVLVAAILLYEKSRSKKNDTARDVINDQANTLTLGQNSESEGSLSMRQRNV